MSSNNTELLIRIRADLGQALTDLNRITGGVEGVGRSAQQAGARIAPMMSALSNPPSAGSTRMIAGMEAVGRAAASTRAEIDRIAVSSQQAASRIAPMMAAMSNQPSLDSIRMTAGMGAMEHSAASARAEIERLASAERNEQAAVQRANAIYADHVSRLSLTNAQYRANQLSLQGLTGAQIQHIRTLEQARAAGLSSSTVFAGMNSTMAAFGVTLGVVGFAGLARDILRTNIEMETLRGRLNGLAGSAAEGSKNFEFILKFAKETPFEIDGITKAFLTLQNFGLKPTTEVMEALTNQSARSGGSAENLTGIAIALGQAWGKGKLQGQEILQLINQSVPIYDLLAKVTGKNSAALFDMAEKGQLTRDVIDKVIIKMGELASGQNAIAMETLKGKISVLSDAWHHYEDTLMGDKSEGLLKWIVDSAARSLDMLSRNMSTVLTDQLAHAEARLKTFNSMNTVAKGATQAIGFIGSGEIYDAKAAAMEIAALKDKLRAENAQKDKQAADEKAKHEAEMAGTQALIKKEENAKTTTEVLAKLTDANKKLTLSQHDYTKQLLESQGLSGKGLTDALALSDANEKLSQSHKDAAKAASSASSEAKKADKAYASEREAVAKNVEQLNFELAALKLSDNEQAIQTKVRSLAAKATDEERVAIEAKVRTLDKETTLIQRQQAMWDQLVKDANTTDELRKNNAELITHGDVQGGFNDALAKTRDQLDQGLITPEQFKAEADKLGKAYNDYFIDPAKSGTNSLSEFSIQAAHNMQSAFADFLFDPFQNGIEGMGANFAKIMQRMVAEAASAQIFESLLGKNYGKDNASGGLLSALFSGVVGAVGGAFGSGATSSASTSVANGNSAAFSDTMSSFQWIKTKHSGGLVGHASNMITADPAIFSAATRYHSGGIPGLAPNEVPIIALDDEEVLTRNDPRHRYNLKNKSTDASVSTSADFNITAQVNVISNSNNADDSNMGGQLGNLVTTSVRQTITTELRAGGLIDQWFKQRG